jgi:hypothetical protein
MLCNYSVYSKHHNLCLHILKSRYVIMIWGVITVHTVSRFTELVRLPDNGCQQPKHVAVDWCHVYVLVCAGCWSVHSLYTAPHTTQYKPTTHCKQTHILHNTNPPLTVHRPTHYTTHTAVSFNACRFCFNTRMRRKYVRDLDKDWSLIMNWNLVNCMRRCGKDEGRSGTKMVGVC